jgi:hypothetical protein
MRPLVGSHQAFFVIFVLAMSEVLVNEPVLEIQVWIGMANHFDKTAIAVIPIGPLIGKLPSARNFLPVIS